VSKTVQRRNGTNERGQLILEQLLRAGSLTIEELCERFGISVATARRDLDQLEKQGRLRRTHGGAKAVEPLFYEPFRHVSTFQEEIERHAEEKRRIGIAAAELIEEGDTIAVTAGTTATYVTRGIPLLNKITVVTNTVNVAMELSNRPDLNIFVTGGFMHGGWFSLVGSAATQAMSGIFADKVFIGANGVHAEHGLTAFHPDEAGFNSVMVKQSRQKIVVADRSKLGQVATHLFCPIEDVHVLITDQGATDAEIAPFRAKGIEVRRV
jgi:DeoR family transcriptional regulator, aga operon transcriptional repressor